VRPGQDIGSYLRTQECARTLISCPNAGLRLTLPRRGPGVKSAAGVGSLNWP
jgi:hypothetical protein